VHAAQLVAALVHAAIYVQNGPARRFHKPDGVAGAELAHSLAQHARQQYARVDSDKYPDDTTEQPRVSEAATNRI